MNRKKQYMYLWGDVVSRGNGETQQVTRFSHDRKLAFRHAKKQNSIVERIAVGKTGIAAVLWPANEEE
jgi:hypothetical protein